MNKLRTRFNRFCLKNRDKGIPNLMLYLSLGAGLVYLFTQFSGNLQLYYLLCFDRALILQGQVWRLVTYPLVYGTENLFLTFVSLFCYYSIGRSIEHIWGTLRFNLFYFSGMLMMDIYCMLLGGSADVTYLNLSLFLSYATMFPDAQFLLLFIIPVKAWIFALFDLVLVLFGLIFYPFPYNLFSIISLANYFLFFGSEVVNVLPPTWRMKLKRKKAPKNQGPKVIHFETNAGPYRPAPKKEDFLHKCTVCGRTDTENPDLEFRYCSRCSGYHCYCIDHINNHEHIEL